MFKGSMVALITPFDKAGKVCKESFDRLIKFHLEQKTNAIVVAGTTGESATLTEAEKLELFEQAVSLVGGKIPVIAGTAKESTESCIDLSKKALTLGVDGLLVMTPAYVKPTQKGLIRHYQAIAKAVDLPIILYNVPGRTACDMLPETVGELSNIDSIVGIKEASGISKRVQQILNVSANDFNVLSGEDGLTVEMMELGAKGVISVTANVLPNLMRKLCDLGLNREFDKAYALQEELEEMHQALFYESNPIPVKWVMSKLLNLKPDLRLPLTELDPKFHEILNQLVEKYRSI